MISGVGILNSATRITPRTGRRGKRVLTDRSPPTDSAGVTLSRSLTPVTTRVSTTSVTTTRTSCAILRVGGQIENFDVCIKPVMQE